MNCNIKRRMVFSILWIVIGLPLVVLSALDVLDSFWSGMGTALLVVGVLQLIKIIRYRKNESYRENVDTEEKDERNKFLNGRAWAWAGYLFVIISAVATIVLKIMGREELMMMASGSLCLLVALYWIAFMILRKKY